MGKVPHKLPDDINQILSDAQELGSKSNICKKYDCTRQSLDDFLRRRGYKLEAKTVWTLRPLSKEEKKG